MLPIRLVLHPTDFSLHSEAASRVAFALARDYGARVLVLHVLEPIALGGLAGLVFIGVHGSSGVAPSSWSRL
jgi:nucleotide-binding universal stress UspA family protein